MAQKLEDALEGLTSFRSAFKKKSQSGNTLKSCIQILNQRIHLWMLNKKKTLIKRAKDFTNVLVQI